jgi:hypothetical protein
MTSEIFAKQDLTWEWWRKEFSIMYNDERPELYRSASTLRLGTEINESSKSWTFNSRGNIKYRDCYRLGCDV